MNIYIYICLCIYIYIYTYIYTHTLVCHTLDLRLTCSFNHLRFLIMQADNLRVLFILACYICICLEGERERERENIFKTLYVFKVK